MGNCAIISPLFVPNTFWIFNCFFTSICNFFTHLLSANAIHLGVWPFVLLKLTNINLPKHIVRHAIKPSSYDGANSREMLLF